MSDNMSCMLKSEPADHLKAINYFKKACDGEIAEGCHRYSSTMLTGIKGVVEVSLFLMKKTCNYEPLSQTSFSPYFCLPLEGQESVFSSILLLG